MATVMVTEKEKVKVKRSLAGQEFDLMSYETPDSQTKR